MSKRYRVEVRDGKTYIYDSEGRLCEFPEHKLTEEEAQEEYDYMRWGSREERAYMMKQYDEYEREEEERENEEFSELIDRYFSGDATPSGDIKRVEKMNHF